ncbi:DUF4876 domain-containing protein [Sphingobacterium daejeonense]|uniref:DUF4876 domain-containing protein n=1 Tax=Sphingobacterium daejeonense TaxID=371142 RepID=UPI0010C4A3B1|nr:DUF4876 domain-containing protein [Sphingobacterium daejeonense]VTP87055.1 Uncharacterised protein [Sphingobacterium daejeonense]
MKNTSLFKWLCFGLMLFSLSSCMKDEFLESRSNVFIELDNSKLVGEYSISNVNIQLQEINSEVITSSTLGTGADTAKANLTYGTYTATLNGEITIKVNGADKKMELKARKSNIVVNSETTNITLQTFLSDPTANFVFKEIFFTGNLTPEGKVYNGDKYFIVHNNSNDTLYADGMFLAQSQFLTTTKRVYTPDVMKDAFTSSEIILLPGTGKQYPVAPGEDIIIANNAINHTEANPNSFDLSKANFEIELIKNINIDNPQVPNATNVAGNLLMTVQGNKSYVMGRFPERMDAEKFKTENAYNFSYVAVNGAVIKNDSYKIPNSYILDAVNVSQKTGFEWLVTSETLDMGWTYAGDKTDERYGKAVIRKPLGVLDNGKPFLQDTNNSTVDFNHATPYSLK